MTEKLALRLALVLVAAACVFVLVEAVRAAVASPKTCGGASSISYIRGHVDGPHVTKEACK